MPIHVIREQSIAYTESGLSEVKDDLYIKLEADLADWLRELQGVRLSAFLFISLNDAFVCVGKGDPSTLKCIASGTGYSERAVLYAVQWLAEHEFITESETLESGAKTYRPKAYAWFGRMREHPAKISPPANCTPLQSHEMNDDVPINNSIKASSSFMKENARLFAEAGFEGVNISRLSEKVTDLAIVRAWCDYVKTNPAQKDNPHGYAYVCLMDNPNALPLEPKKKKKERKREYRAQGPMVEKMRAAREKEKSA